MKHTTTNVFNAAYNEALELVAIGEDRDSARGTIIDNWPTLSIDAISDVLNDALEDALRSGVEREDIDPSWF